MSLARAITLPATLLLGIAACAPLVTERPATAPPAQSGGTSVERALPTAPSRSDRTPAPRPAKARPAPAEESIPAPKLVGLSESDTLRLLGQPAEEAAQPPGKIWLYRAQGCTLRVHLFPDMAQGGFHALDYTAEDAARDACLGKVATTAAKTAGD